MLEQEERYKISEVQLKKILEISQPLIEEMDMLDVSFYENGNNLYDLYKYIIRIRQKDTKKTLEIKNYNDDNTCLEGAINLDSIGDAVNFLSLMNLQPAIYLKRKREVRKFKGLKIFIDKFDIIDNYVEIEYQDSMDYIGEILEFKSLCKIDGAKESLYGKIIHDKLKKDSKFKEIFDKKMKEIIQNL